MRTSTRSESFDAASQSASQPLLEVENLTRVYERPGEAPFTAADHVSFIVQPGECLGLVGPSGCGKSTTANMVLRLLDATSGTIRLNGRDITHARGRQLRGAYQLIQAVFQDPQQSFDPRRTLGYGVAEPLRNQGMARPQAQAEALRMMERCGLPDQLVERYPAQVSGGQCQRAAIARALVVQPRLLVCDEATSALDVTVQQRIVQLLQSLQRERHLALLFISHDLALVSRICDRVAVMHAGRIVEQGPTAQVIAHPQSEHTRQLLAAAQWEA